MFGLLWPVLATVSLGLAAEEPLSVEASRATFAMGALTMDPGLADLAWGGERLVAPGGGGVTAAPTFLALGLREDVELQLGTRGWFRATSPGRARNQGLGALTVGAQGCFSHDGWLGTDQAVAVSHQFPGATPDPGDPRTVDAVALLTSGTWGVTHVDLNLVQAWLGRTGVPGQGRAGQFAVALAGARPLTPAWTLTGEVYALGPADGQGPITSTVWSLARKNASRLTVDVGCEVGLSRSAPRYTLLAGVTLELGPWW